MGNLCAAHSGVIEKALSSKSRPVILVGLGMGARVAVRGAAAAEKATATRGEAVGWTASPWTAGTAGAFTVPCARAVTNKSGRFSRSNHGNVTRTRPEPKEAGLLKFRII